MADPSHSDWPEAIAEVLTCRYTMRAGRALAFGLPSQRHFQITYQYRVGDELHTGECFAARAMPQGMLFPVRYDPAAPHQHATGDQTGPPQRLLFAVALAGFFALSLVSLAFLHGCQ